MHACNPPPRGWTLAAPGSCYYGGDSGDSWPLSCCRSQDPRSECLQACCSAMTSLAVSHGAIQPWPDNTRTACLCTRAQQSRVLQGSAAARNRVCAHTDTCLHLRQRWTPPVGSIFVQINASAFQLLPQGGMGEAQHRRHTVGPIQSTAATANGATPVVLPAWAGSDAAAHQEQHNLHLPLCTPGEGPPVSAWAKQMAWTACRGDMH